MIGLVCKILSVFTAALFVGHAAAETHSRNTRSDNSLPFDASADYPTISVRQTRLEAFANFTETFVRALNELGVTKKVTESYRKTTPRMLQVLIRSGQVGYLVLIEIEVSKTTGVKDLVGGAVYPIGAGTDPTSVLALYLSKPTIRSSVRDGFRISEEDSYFVWVSGLQLPGNRMVTERTIRAPLVYSDVRRLLSDRMLFAQAERAARARAIGDAARALELNVEDRKFREKVQALRVARERALSRANEIDKELRGELERAERANRMANVFSTIAKVFSVAGQVVQIRNMMGSDAPPNLDSKSAPELELLIKEWGQQAVRRGETFRAEHKQVTDRISGTTTELLQIFRERKILSDVPALQ